MIVIKDCPTCGANRIRSDVSQCDACEIAARYETRIEGYDTTLTTLRAENERLREALREVIRAHDGMHTRTCSAALDGLYLVDGDLNDGDCDCGATERRNDARAALVGG